MNKRLILTLILASVAGLMLFGLYFVAETYPFHVGNLFYPLQLGTEHVRLQFTSGETQQATFAVHLVERRLADLARAHDPGTVHTAATQLDQALVDALAYVERLSGDEQQALQDQISLLLYQTDVVISSLEGEDAQDSAVLPLRQKIDATLQPAQPETQPKTMRERLGSAIPAQTISFLGYDIYHNEFPLTAEHDYLECLDCHTDGTYVDTSTDCSTCHSLDEYELRAEHLAVYPDHFAGECAECHGIAGWEPTQFAHEDLQECTTCHADEAPDALPPDDMANLNTWKMNYLVGLSTPTTPHYTGECMDCHQDATDWTVVNYEHAESSNCATCHQSEVAYDHYRNQCASCHTSVDDWNELEFDHTGYMDCQSCHRDSDPLAHYPGQCSACHDTHTWFSVQVNHDGLSDCTTCHEKPAGHYGGDCADCHKKNLTWDKARFNHAGFNDCASCHDTPRDHYLGQCSRCHVTQDWGQISFSHLDLLTCASCHDDAAPSGHYPGECSNCHESTEWEDADFDHTGFTDCATCHTAPVAHYAGVCSECHNTTDWTDAKFVHPVDTNCTSCHDKPTGHWTGACGNCHNTSNWYEINFDHTNFSDCKACHPRPAGHPRGQCSNCHTTETWIIEDTSVFAPLLRVAPEVEEPSNR